MLNRNALGPIGLVTASAVVLGVLLTGANQTGSLVPPSDSPEPLFEAGGTALEPYVVHKDPTTLRVSWRTRTEQASRIELRLGGEPVENLTTEAAYQHMVEFSMLKPDREYLYQVDGYQAVSVRTLPVDQSIRFAVLGHTHGTERQGHYPDSMLVSSIASLDPDFVVHAGDCVYYSTLREWKVYFFDLFRNLLKTTPVYISPSNHDSGYPFLKGYDLRCFKELFPLAYPEGAATGAEDAYYSIRQGPIDFFFLSYVADMTPEGKQVLWLLRELDKSTAPFRIVVFGGVNRFYDRKKFLAALPAERVDLIINGDGSAFAKLKEPGDLIPVAVVGVAPRGPSPWLACLADEHRATFQTMLASGEPESAMTLHCRDRKEPKVDLGEGSVTKKGAVKTFSYVLPEPVEASELQGVQLSVSNPSGGKGFCSVRMIPLDEPSMRGKRNMPAFGTQAYTFEGSDDLLTFSLPSPGQLAPSPLKVKSIQVVLNARKPEVEMGVSNVFLY